MCYLDSIHTAGRLGIFVDRLDTEIGHKEKVVAIIIWGKRRKFPLEGEEAEVKRSIRVRELGVFENGDFIDRYRPDIFLKVDSGDKVEKFP